MTIGSLSGILHGKKRSFRSTLSGLREATMKSKNGIPKGHFTVYVGDEESEKTRHVVPLWYLNEPAFQQLLSMAEDEFGHDHFIGPLTIPCTENVFVNLTSHF